MRLPDKKDYDGHFVYMWSWELIAQLCVVGLLLGFYLTMYFF